MQNARNIIGAPDSVPQGVVALPKDYVHNVFISYNYTELMKKWVNGPFKELFEEYLGNALNDDARVGLFEREAIAGQHWPQRLRDMLLRSRVLLAICSPGYFRSGWCLSEWESFRLREEQLKRDGLRIPLLHNDGKHYMTQHGVQWIQHVDFTKCAFFIGDPNKHPKGPEFEQKVYELADMVAEQVTKAPPFDPDWPLAEMPSVPTPNQPLQQLGQSH
ncbi:MAG: TIR domain-containing protein [Pyrinomonadaceae bacterium]